METSALIDSTIPRLLSRPCSGNFWSGLDCCNRLLERAPRGLPSQMFSVPLFCTTLYESLPCTFRWCHTSAVGIGRCHDITATKQVTSPKWRWRMFEGATRTIRCMERASSRTVGRGWKVTTTSPSPCRASEGRRERWKTTIINKARIPSV